MALPIEGYSVVAQKSRISHLLERNAIEIPNRTALGDDDIWRCCFMEKSDALKFIEFLAELDLNVSQGPDSDVVLVSEFDHSIYPYCEWLVMAEWEKAVIAWKAGAEPDSIVAHEGWDPKVGSGLSFHDRDSMDHLEFLRLEDQVEVYLNKNTGEEVYIGRTSPPVDAMFKTATQTISKYFVTAGEKPLGGEQAGEVREAVALLEQAIVESPDSWRALWYLGKGQLALGEPELAYESFQRAYSLEKNVEAVPRELAGVCLELGKFEEAVSVGEQSVALDPDDVGLIGNLALAYLLAGRIEEANKSIAAAVKLDSSDKINGVLQRIITEVANGERAQPTSLASLSKGG